MASPTSRDVAQLFGKLKGVLDRPSGAGASGGRSGVHHGTSQGAAHVAALQQHQAAVASAVGTLLAQVQAFVAANEHPATSPNYASADNDPVEAFVEMLLHSALRPRVTDASGSVRRSGGNGLTASASLPAGAPVQDLATAVSALQLGHRPAPLPHLHLGGPTHSEPEQMAPTEGAPKHIAQQVQLQLLVLQSLKILSRKQPNRLRIGEAGVRGVLLALAPPASFAIAAEGANVFLNIAYEADNVLCMLRTPAARILASFLTEQDEALQANSAGALQSISFLPAGRRAVRDAGALPALLALLWSPSERVLGRAVGAVHNMSSDSTSIREIRTHGAIPRLVHLLDSPHAAVAGNAAGALQNVSREVASRLVIRELDAVPPLARMLSCSDAQAQVCAAGALLNIMGPELDAPPGGSGNRRAFGRIMSLVMTLATVHDGVFGARQPSTA